MRVRGDEGINVKRNRAGKRVELQGSFALECADDGAVAAFGQIFQFRFRRFPAQRRVAGGKAAIAADDHAMRFGVEEARARAAVASPGGGQERARIDRERGGVLTLNEAFDRSWRRVGLALDRVGFTVEDRDRSQVADLQFHRLLHQHIALPKIGIRKPGASTEPS